MTSSSQWRREVELIFSTRRIDLLWGAGGENLKAQLSQPFQLMILCLRRGLAGFLKLHLGLYAVMMSRSLSLQPLILPKSPFVFFHLCRWTRQKTNPWRSAAASWFPSSTTPRSPAWSSASSAVLTSLPWTPTASLTLMWKRQYTRRRADSTG